MSFIRLVACLVALSLFCTPALVAQSDDSQAGRDDTQTGPAVESAPPEEASSVLSALAGQQTAMRASRAATSPAAASALAASAAPPAGSLADRPFRAGVYGYIDYWVIQNAGSLPFATLFPNREARPFDQRGGDLLQHVFSTDDAVSWTVGWDFESGTRLEVRYWDYSERDSFFALGAPDDFGILLEHGDLGADEADGITPSRGNIKAQHLEFTLGNRIWDDGRFSLGFDSSLVFDKYNSNQLTRYLDGFDEIRFLGRNDISSVGFKYGIFTEYRLNRWFAVETRLSHSFTRGKRDVLRWTRDVDEPAVNEPFNESPGSIDFNEFSRIRTDGMPAEISGEVSFLFSPVPWADLGVGWRLSHRRDVQTDIFAPDDVEEQSTIFARRPAAFDGVFFRLGIHQPDDDYSDPGLPTHTYPSGGFFAYDYWFQMNPVTLPFASVIRNRFDNPRLGDPDAVGDILKHSFGTEDGTFFDLGWDFANGMRLGFRWWDYGGGSGFNQINPFNVFPGDEDFGFILSDPDDSLEEGPGVVSRAGLDVNSFDLYWSNRLSGGSRFNLRWDTGIRWFEYEKDQFTVYFDDDIDETEPTLIRSETDGVGLFFGPAGEYRAHRRVTVTYRWDFGLTRGTQDYLYRNRLVDDAQSSPIPFEEDPDDVDRDTVLDASESFGTFQSSLEAMIKVAATPWLNFGVGYRYIHLGTVDRLAYRPDDISDGQFIDSRRGASFDGLFLRTELHTRGWQDPEDLEPIEGHQNYRSGFFGHIDYWLVNSPIELPFASVIPQRDDNFTFNGGDILSHEFSDFDDVPAFELGYDFDNGMRVGVRYWDYSEGDGFAQQNAIGGPGDEDFGPILGSADFGLSSASGVFSTGSVKARQVDVYWGNRLFHGEKFALRFDIGARESRYLRQQRTIYVEDEFDGQIVRMRSSHEGVGFMGNLNAEYWFNSYIGLSGRFGPGFTRGRRTYNYLAEEVDDFTTPNFEIDEIVFINFQEKTSLLQLDGEGAVLVRPTEWLETGIGYRYARWNEADFHSQQIDDVNDNVVNFAFRDVTFEGFFIRAGFRWGP